MVVMEVFQDRIMVVMVVFQDRIMVVMVVLQDRIMVSLTLMLVIATISTSIQQVSHCIYPPSPSTPCPPEPTSDPLLQDD